MSVQEPQTSETEMPREQWGNDMIVISDDDETGSWIMFDPETDEVALENWR